MGLYSGTIRNICFRFRAKIARGEERRGRPGPQPGATNMKEMVSVDNHLGQYDDHVSGVGWGVVSGGPGSRWPVQVCSRLFGLQEGGEVVRGGAEPLHLQAEHQVVAGDDTRSWSSSLGWLILTGTEQWLTGMKRSLSSVIRRYSESYKEHRSHVSISRWNHSSLQLPMVTILS